MLPVTPDKLITSMNVVTYVSLSAVIGSLFNILMVVTLRFSSASLGKMVIFLSSFDMILGLSSQMFMTKTDSYLVCQIRCFLWAVGWTGSIFWTCCFAHCLWITVKRMDGTSPDLYFKRYCIFSTLLAVVWGIYAVYIVYFQVEYETCYHDSTRKDFNPLKIIIFEVPLYFGVIFSLGCYISVIRELVRVSSRLFIELLFYPAVVIICNLPTVAIKLGLTINPSFQMPFWFTIMAIVLFYSQGIINALIYGLSKTMIKKIKEKCTQKKPTKIKRLEQSKLLASELSAEVSEITSSEEKTISPAPYVAEP